GISFLYVVAFILAGAYLRPRQIVLLALLCAVLREVLNLSDNSVQLFFRFAFSFTNFALTGLAFREMARSRQWAVENLRRLGDEMQRRQEAEEEIRIVIESSPAAIFLVGSSGDVLMANTAAGKLLGFGQAPLEGECIWPYLPVLETAQLGRRDAEFLNVN